MESKTRGILGGLFNVSRLDEGIVTFDNFMENFELNWFELGEAIRKGWITTLESGYEYFLEVLLFKECAVEGIDQEVVERACDFSVNPSNGTIEIIVKKEEIKRVVQNIHQFRGFLGEFDFYDIWSS